VGRRTLTYTFLKRLSRYKYLWYTGLHTFKIAVELHQILDSLNAACSAGEKCKLWRDKYHAGGRFRLYSHAPQNDVSVNDGPHIRRWSHKICCNTYHCVTIACSIQYSNMLYKFVA